MQTIYHNIQNIFGRALRLFKYLYVMNNFKKLFSSELIEWVLEAGFIQFQCHISIYYKYAPNRTKIVIILC